VRYVAQDAVGFVGRGPSAVRLADGSDLPCDIAVNAAGPWAARVAAWLGIDLPVRARKRMIFVIACRAPLPGCPLVIDPTGIWWRPEGRLFLCGRSPDAGESDPDEAPLDVDESMFHERIWPVLADRVPAFESLKITSAWAGYYELNLFDQNGIVGRHPTAPNLIFANGFSGHGMQHSPAVGRHVAELIADGEYTTLDLSPLAFDRVLAGRRMVERNVV
jgi:FAD-dependent oxidoreductase domain-containing protein 1